MKEFVFHSGRNRGGYRATLVGLYDPNQDKENIAVGIAVCNPDDKFKRSLGREIAWGRALFVMEGYSKPSYAYTGRKSPYKEELTEYNTIYLFYKINVKDFNKEGNVGRAFKNFCYGILTKKGFSPSVTEYHGHNNKMDNIYNRKMSKI